MTGEIKLHGMEDREDKCYMIGVPEDMTEESVRDVVDHITGTMENAKLIFFRGAVESDLVVGGIDASDIERLGETGR